MTTLPSFETFFLADAIAMPTGEADAGGDTDARLVHRARGGDKGAERLLYVRHVRYVEGLLVKLLASRTDAEDAVQETFVLALDHLADLRDGAAFRGWLAQIAVSQARRRFRRRKLLRLLGMDRGDDDGALERVAGTGPSESVRAEIATLQQLLGRLGTEERLAWSLRHLEGDSLEEVAAHCACSLATAKRRIASADAFLRAELGVHEGAS